MHDVGRKIKELREQKGMSQEELAHLVGYKSRSSINKLELQRDVPIKKLKPIANVLGIDVKVLLGWDEPDTNEGDVLASIFKDKEVLEYTEKLIQLKDDDKKIVFNMIDALHEKDR